MKLVICELLMLALSSVSSVHIHVISDANLKSFREQFRYSLVMFHEIGEFEKSQQTQMLQALSKDLLPTIPSLMFGECHKQTAPKAFSELKLLQGQSLIFFMDGEPVPYKGNMTAEDIASWVRQIKSKKIREISSKEEYKSLEKSKLTVLLVMERRSLKMLSRFRAMAAAYPEIQFFYSAMEHVRSETSFKAFNLVVFRGFDTKRKSLAEEQEFSLQDMINFFEMVRHPVVREWNSEVRNLVLDQQKNSVILFLEGQKHTSLAPYFEKMAEVNRAKYLFFTADLGSSEGKSLSEDLGAGVHGQAVILIFFAKDMRKFVLDWATEGSLNELLIDIDKNVALPFYKSEAPTDRKEGNIEIVVGKTFGKKVLRRRGQVVFLLAYKQEPNKTEEESLLHRLSRKFDGFERAVFAKIDVRKNEHHSLITIKVPTFQAYWIDALETPLEYVGELTFWKLYQWMANVVGRDINPEINALQKQHAESGASGTWEDAAERDL